MTKKYRYTIILDDEERAMLNFLTNKGLYTYKTVLRLCIRGRYFSETQKLKNQGINIILDNYLPCEEEMIKNQKVDKDQITLDQVLDEQAELEKLKAERRARKNRQEEGDHND